MKFIFYFLLVALCFLHKGLFAQHIQIPNTDPRFIGNGKELPSKTYADQPYIIVCDDGSWLCTITTSSGTEAAHMNYIISTKSYDQGETWTTPVSLEKPGIPQSSWAVPLKVPGGRIYVFYNYNKFLFTGREGVNSGPFAYRYSDDHGKTWSENRYEVPIRKTKIDEANYTNGKYQFFWSIDKPVVTKNAAYITFSKIQRDSTDQPVTFSRSEGFILKSQNILEEKNPEKIKWTTLPDGDTGINNPQFGRVQAEHNMEVMNNGDLYVVYRTIEGFPAYSISSDDGKTFSDPKIMRYTNGEPMGNPRACPKIYKTKEGKFLLWFHNNFNKGTWYGRNPAWLSGGIEKNGVIEWSQPEIVLYTLDPAMMGMSYPDFIEQSGQLWISETQKNIARVHKIDLNLVQGMWKKEKDAGAVDEGLIMESDLKMIETGKINFPALPDLHQWGGFTVDLWLTADALQPGQKVFSTVGPKGKGIEIAIAENNAIKISLYDGEIREVDINDYKEFVSDENVLGKGDLHHVVFIIDGAAKVASIMVDGILSDGGLDSRSHGWGRIYQHLTSLNDTHLGTFNEEFSGKVYNIRLYNRALRTAEAILNFNAGINK